mmetsp:Transcript_14228/g.36374  ORF Transcript_14228/g.36374 Transcript_14228/m.36374 type:complete len:494 (+) Transcript_14228:67-1548(+)
MGDYVKVPIKSFPAVPDRKNVESRYWQEFRFPTLDTHSHPVTHVSVCPKAPHNFAVTTFTKVHIYSPETSTIVKTIGRFKDVAYSGHYRDDGRVIVAGGETGIVQLFDTQSRSILRGFKGHEGAVHVTRCSPDLVTVFSGGDDKTVRHWDVPTEKECWRGVKHQDYIRCGEVLSAGMFITGSYDRCVNVWDVRQAAPAMTLELDGPVLSVLPSSSGTLLYAAAGSQLRIFNLLAGGKLLHVAANHQKPLTALALDSRRGRLLTASLDHQVKVYDPADYRVVHTVKYPSPILSLAVSPDSSTVVVGMSDGLVSIRKRVAKAGQNLTTPTSKKLHAGTYKYLMRHDNAAILEDDFKVAATKRAKLRPYDKLLRAFRFGEALNAALETKHAVVAISVLEDIVRRGGLMTALAGRDETSLQMLLQFAITYVTNPRYSALLIDVTERLLELYADMVGRSVVIDDLLLRLQKKVHAEIAFQHKLMETLGALEVITAHGT